MLLNRLALQIVTQAQLYYKLNKIDYYKQIIDQEYKC